MLRNFFRKSFPFKKLPVSGQINFKAIEKIIRYKFHDKNYLSAAFKHKSYLIIHREPSHKSNERLEFLGDAVLDLVVTEFLFRELPHESEGVLSKIKSVLVSRKVLAQIISDMDLGRYLLMNRGEEQTGGRNRMSNMANLYESILGAIYMDGRLKAAEKFISFTLLDSYDTFISDQDHINYKSLLLEYAQSEGLGIPRYILLKESGPDHEKHFEIEVSLADEHSATGKGKSKKIAEQNSARNLLEIIAPEHIEKLTQR
jgi:ribonuclease-3